MHHYNHYFVGMHFFWWIIWIIIIIWIFVTPWDIPGQRKKDTAMEILKKRLANGEISIEEFEEKKKILQQN